MTGRDEEPTALLERLLGAVNAHDTDRLVACFADDYVNETPAHPSRGFRGRGQVRENWAQIFAGVPDVRAWLSRVVADGDTLWTEWEIAGTRSAGAPFSMRGVIIFRVERDVIVSARFYLEPVEETSGDVTAHTRRLVEGAVRSDVRQ